MLFVERERSLNVKNAGRRCVRSILGIHRPGDVLIARNQINDVVGEINPEMDPSFNRCHNSLRMALDFPMRSGNILQAQMRVPAGMTHSLHHFPWENDDAGMIAHPVLYSSKWVHF